MHLLPVLWLHRGSAQRSVLTVLSAALPNLFILLVITANFAWMYEGGGMLGVSFPFAENLWLESLLTVGAVVVLDIAAVTLFFRRWRTRRWGRKPAEVEAATRYFNG